MGVWDHSTFGNDDACDWAGDLQGYQDLTLIKDTLDRVVQTGDGYLESFDALQAIAAAEVVARLRGQFGLQNSYTESVDTWVESHPQNVPIDLTQKSVLVLDRILTQPSELLELWEESDLFEAWKESNTVLKNRVKNET